MFNNGALSFVELEMKAAGIVTYGTDLDNPDFAGIARAVGLFGVRVERADQLEDALQEAFRHNGPALVEVRTARHELSLPPKLTYGELKGFTLYATRTVLSGGGRGAHRARRDQPARTRRRMTQSPPTPAREPGPGQERPYWTLVLPLTLLILLGLAGLRGAVSAPHWNGPLRHDGVVIGAGAGGRYSGPCW